MRMPGACIASLGVVLAVLSCSNDTSGPPPLSYGDTGVLDQGYTGTGFASFGQVLDPQFLYLYFNDALPEGSWNCLSDGYCGLGGMTNQFGAVAAADSFLFVSTANFFDAGSNNEVVVVSSGVVTKDLTIPNPSQFDSLRVSFEWSFLTSRFDPATHNDSIIVRLRTSSDSTRLFKVTTDDLQAGRYAEKAGGCGTQSVIPSRPILYAHCTDWALKTVDVTGFLSRTFALEFIVSEGSQNLADQVDQPTAFLFRKLKIEGGK
jgi:hypothetical protein